MISSLIGDVLMTSCASFNAFCLSCIRCLSVNLFTTCKAVTPPKPTAAYKSSSLAK